MKPVWGKNMRLFRLIFSGWLRESQINRPSSLGINRTTRNVDFFMQGKTDLARRPELDPAAAFGSAESGGRRLEIQRGTA